MLKEAARNQKPPNTHPNFCDVSVQCHQQPARSESYSKGNGKEYTSFKVRPVTDAALVFGSPVVLFIFSADIADNRGTVHFVITL